jgi:hypothetical protein
MSEAPSRREELPPHPLTEKELTYVASLSAERRELHELAVKMLGSSYFVERTHGYRKATAATAATAAKK